MRTIARIILQHHLYFCVYLESHFPLNIQLHHHSEASHTGLNLAMKEVDECQTPLLSEPSSGYKFSKKFQL